MTHQAVIDSLVTDLRPAARLAPPGRRAGWWLLGTIVLGAIVVAASPARVGAMARLEGASDLMVGFLAAAATALAAAVACFNLALPDRSSRWAWLPLPPLALWVAASGAGCLRPWLAPGTEPASMAHSTSCFLTIVTVSLPLSLALILMLRLAAPLRPLLTALTGGLAAAAASATVLALIHPFDATASDLSMHLLAVLLVLAANTAAARWLGLS